MKLSIKKRLTGVLALSLLTLAVASAPAQSTLFDNLPGSSTYTSVATTQFKAMGITMGHTAFTLDSVTLTLNVRADAFYLNLFSDNGGHPSSSLTPLSPTTSLVSGTTANYTFTSDSPFTLLAGETYWFVASGGGTSASTATQWRRTTTTATVDPDITFAGARSTSDGGTSWSSSSVLYTLHVEGTISPIPEPSTIALSVAGGFALLAGYRRHRTK